MKTERLSVLVVGAGPAGLAAAQQLSRRGLDPTVVERTSAVGDVWAGHYDRLRINTLASVSFLPGLRFPKGAGDYPSRDEVVAYLKRYAETFVSDLRTGVEVAGLEPLAQRGTWRVTGTGIDAEVGAVVLALGMCSSPKWPDWPGRETFRGELFHSSSYREASAYRGRRVLVVGAGNSGFDLVLDCLDAGAEVFLSVRTPAHLLPRRFLGLSVQRFGIVTRWLPAWVGDGWAELARRRSGLTESALGFPQPHDSVSVHYKKTGIPPVSNPEVPQALRTGRIRVVPAVTGFDGPEVLLEGGRRLAADVVLAATGYHRSLEQLVGPWQGAPRLYRLGYSDPITGNLREIRLEARRLALQVARDLKRSTARHRG